MDSLKKLEKNDMKYIFFDIDGTLTDNTTGKNVPSAQENGRAHGRTPFTG